MEGVAFAGKHTQQQLLDWHVNYSIKVVESIEATHGSTVVLFSNHHGVVLVKEKGVAGSSGRASQGCIGVFLVKTPSTNSQLRNADANNDASLEVLPMGYLDRCTVFLWL